MKNHELIDILKRLPADLEIFMSCDEEGNSFAKLYDVEVSPHTIDDMYREYSPIHPDDLDDYEDEEVRDAIFLWP